MYRISRFRDDAKTMRVRLVKKLADMIDDIDLSRARIGDVLTLRFEQAFTCANCGHFWAADMESLPPEIQEKIPDALRDL